MARFTSLLSALVVFIGVCVDAAPRVALATAPHRTTRRVSDVRGVALVRSPSAPLSGQGPAITFCAPPPTSVPQPLALFQLCVNVSRSYANPFDSGEITVSATFTHADAARAQAPPPPPLHDVTGSGTRCATTSGQPDTVTVDGFWFQNYTVHFTPNETLVPSGDAHWLVRFAPPRSGSWQWRVTATDTQGSTTTAVATVSVGTAGARGTGPSSGYVRVSSANPRMFELEDGTPFFLVGEDACGYELRGNVTTAYDRWFGRLGAVGGNYARVWALDNEAVPTSSFLALEKFALGKEYELTSAWCVVQRANRL